MLYSSIFERKLQVEKCQPLWGWWACLTQARKE